MTANLEASVTGCVNKLLFGQCEHSLAEGDAFVVPAYECLECTTRIIQLFGMSQIAVGRRLEREEKSHPHTEETP